MAGEIRPDHVAIYVRWSTDDQSDGTTLEVQLQGCRHYILSQGWQVRDALIFIDDGYSGGTLQRPALARLRRLAQEGQVDCVVVFKLDRLSRSVIDMVTLVLREWESKTFVKSAREPVDTTSAMGKQFFYMLVSFAEWERNVIRERTQSGKLKRAQEGRNPGFRAPYGYITGERAGSFVVVEAEAALVRRIFDLYAAGFGCRAIAAEFNQAGLRFRGGHPWSESTVLYILRNRLYAGELVYGRRPRAAQGRSADRRAADPVVAQVAGLTPLIPATTFERVAALRAGRTAERLPARAQSSPHLLTGLLRCMQCGHALIARQQPVTARQPRPLAYYVCGGQKNKGRATCAARYIRQDLLDAWVVEQLLARYGGQLGRQRLQADLCAATAEQVAAMTAELAALRQEECELEEQMKVLTRDYLKQKLRVEDYTLLKAEVQAQKQRLADDLLARTAEIERLQARQIAADALEHAVCSSLDDWETLTGEQRKHLLRQLIASLRVYKPDAGSDLLYDLVWVGSGEPGRGA